MAIELDNVDVASENKENGKKRLSTKHHSVDCSIDNSKKSKSESTAKPSKSKSKAKPATKEEVVEKHLNINTHRVIVDDRVAAFSFVSELSSFLEKELDEVRRCNIGFHPFENTETQLTRMKLPATVSVVNATTVRLKCSKTKSKQGFLFNNDMIRQLVHKFLKKKKLYRSVVNIRCSNTSMDLILANTVASRK